MTDHQCGSCGDQGCTGLCRAALPKDLRALGYPVCDRGAAEIERLRAALREIAERSAATDAGRSIARAALAEDGKP